MSEKNTPVDFSNPASIAEELAAADAQPKSSTKKKERKPRKPRTIKVTYTAPKDIKAGETIEFVYEIPKSTRTRGAVAGIPVPEMTDDQLKIEYRNANSVYYKTKKAGRDTTKAEERLNGVKAEMAKRGIQPTARTSAKVDAAAIANLIKSGQIKVEDIQAMLDAQQ